MKVNLPKRCKDCDGQLSVGFIVDSSYGMEVVSTWQEGAPQKKWWAMGGITKSGATRIEVNTLRCEKCGLLRDYAVAP
jgi:hypothetical protein